MFPLPVGLVLALLLLSSPLMTRTTNNLRRSTRISAKCKETSEVVEESASTTLLGKRRKSTEVTSSTSAPSLVDMPPLLNLGKLIGGSLVKRPSATIRSPYVADVSLMKGKVKSSTTVLAHAPSLDVGGMCVAGSEVYMSERNGEGKTSHSIELVRGAPLGATNINGTSEEGVLVGAHPRLGELIAAEVLKRGLLADALPLKNGYKLGPVNCFESKKASPKKTSPKKRKSISDTNDTMSKETITADANRDPNDSTAPKMKINLQQQCTIGDSRVDFQMTLTNTLNNTSHQILFEVKNVVCADYEAGTEPTPTGPGHCVVVAPSKSDFNDEENEYERSALFPWGRTRGQKFEGKSVVSERACKHLRNLQSQLSKDITPVVLFIVNRSDCESVRACHEKCPVFAEVLADVINAGVKALAVRVRWTDEGECFYDGVLPVVV